MADSLVLDTPPTRVDSPPERYVDWGAIIGGALLAVMLSLILFILGSALGLSATSVEPQEGVSLQWVAIASGIWLIWMLVTSSAVGGYFAGRMRKPAGDVSDDEIETRDGAHGLVSWAVASLLTLTLATMGIGNILSGVTQGASSVLGSSAEGLSSLIEENANELANVVLRNQDALPSEEAAKEIAAVLMSGIEQGDVSEADSAYLAKIVARETSLDQNEARSRIDQAVAEAEEVKEEFIAAAEQTRVASLISAFVLAASLLVAAAAAYFAAVKGGDHRNSSIGFNSTQFWMTRRKRLMTQTSP